MSADGVMPIWTLVAVLVLSSTFVFGARIHPLQLFLEKRNALSCGAGASLAYIFIHVLPELGEGRESFKDGVEGYFEGLEIYFVSLLGVIVFYSLHHISRKGHGTEKASLSFWLSIIGFAFYTGLVGYSAAHGAADSSSALTFFTIAFGGHFLSVDHMLIEQHKGIYLKRGRWVMGAMPILGWLVAELLPSPEWILALSFAFIAGSVMINSAIQEIEEGAEGQLSAFIGGAVVYTALLLPLSL